MTVASTTEEAEDGVAGSSMWLHRDEGTMENIHCGLFTLESRPRVVICQLLARVRVLQGTTVCLPNCASLLLAAVKHGVVERGLAAGPRAHSSPSCTELKLNGRTKHSPFPPALCPQTRRYTHLPIDGMERITAATTRSKPQSSSHLGT